MASSSGRQGKGRLYFNRHYRDAVNSYRRKYGFDVLQKKEAAHRLFGGDKTDYSALEHLAYNDLNQDETRQNVLHDNSDRIHLSRDVSRYLKAYGEQNQSVASKEEDYPSHFEGLLHEGNGQTPRREEPMLTIPLPETPGQVMPQTPATNPSSFRTPDPSYQLRKGKAGPTLTPQLPPPPANKPASNDEKLPTNQNQRALFPETPDDEGAAAMKEATNIKANNLYSQDMKNTIKVYKHVYGRLPTHADVLAQVMPENVGAVRSNLHSVQKQRADGSTVYVDKRLLGRLHEDMFMDALENVDVPAAGFTDQERSDLYNKAKEYNSDLNNYNQMMGPGIDPNANYETLVKERAAKDKNVDRALRRQLRIPEEGGPGFFQKIQQTVKGAKERLNAAFRQNGDYEQKEEEIPMQPLFEEEQEPADQQQNNERDQIQDDFDQENRDEGKEEDDPRDPNPGNDPPDEPPNAPANENVNNGNVDNENVNVSNISMLAQDQQTRINNNAAMVALNGYTHMSARMGRAGAWQGALEQVAGDALAIGAAYFTDGASLSWETAGNTANNGNIIADGVEQLVNDGKELVGWAEGRREQNVDGRAALDTNDTYDESAANNILDGKEQLGGVTEMNSGAVDAATEKLLDGPDSTQNVFDTLRMNYGQAQAADVLPDRRTALASDIKFDMFDYVSPGFGNGEANKLFQLEQSHADNIRYGGKLMEQTYIGPINGVAVPPWQLQRAIPRSYIEMNDAANAFEKTAEMDARFSAEMTGQSTNVLGDDVGYKYSMSSKSLPRKQMSVFEPAIRTDFEWSNVQTPIGVDLNRKRFRLETDAQRYPRHLAPSLRQMGGPTLQRRRALEVILP